MSIRPSGSHSASLLSLPIDFQICALYVRADCSLCASRDPPRLCIPHYALFDRAHSILVAFVIVYHTMYISPNASLTDSWPTIWGIHGTTAEISTTNLLRVSTCTDFADWPAETHIWGHSTAYYQCWFKVRIASIKVWNYFKLLCIAYLKMFTSPERVGQIANAIFEQQLARLLHLS